MVQILRKWRVDVVFASPSADIAPAPAIRFYISDNYVQNAMRVVSALDFGADRRVAILSFTEDVPPASRSGLTVTPFPTGE